MIHTTHINPKNTIVHWLKSGGHIGCSGVGELSFSTDRQLVTCEKCTKAMEAHKPKERVIHYLNPANHLACDAKHPASYTTITHAVTCKECARSLNPPKQQKPKQSKKGTLGKRTCESCIHWKKISTMKIGFCQHQYFNPSTFGILNKPTMLNTTPNFGCIHHSPIPSSKASS